MDTAPTYLLASLSLLALAGVAIYRRIRFSIKHIRGPPCSFWRGKLPHKTVQSNDRLTIPLLEGNMRDFFYQPDVGMMDSQYTEDYGLVWRMGAPFGVSE